MTPQTAGPAGCPSPSASQTVICGRTHNGPRKGGQTRPSRRGSGEVLLQRPGTVLKAAVAVSGPELTVGVARIFGFDRTGNDLDRAISDQIDRMTQMGQIQDTEGKLQLIEA